jgi:hypothetical protein
VTIPAAETPIVPATAPGRIVAAIARRRSSARANWRDAVSQACARLDEA